MASNSAAMPCFHFQAGQKIHINKFDVVVERYLSQGGFSHLYLVNCPDVQQQMVLKLVLGNEDGNTTSVDMEIGVLKSFQGLKDGLSLIKMIDHTIRPKSNGKKGFECLMLLEFCPGGSVIDLLKDYKEVRRSSLSERQILAILYDTTDAIALLHAAKPQAIIHRDIKPENILIARDGRYKLCDFGSCTREAWISLGSREVPLKQIEIEKTTTLTYRAPEMCDLYRGAPVTTKVDIWALGIVTFLLMFQKYPFDSQLAILNGSISIPETSGYSKELYGLLCWMLIKDPVKRPNAYQVMSALCKMAQINNSLDPGRYTDCSDITFDEAIAKRETLISSKNSSNVSTTNTNSIMIDPSLNPNLLMGKSFEGEDVKAMRRGRPAKKNTTTAAAAEPSINLAARDISNPFEYKDNAFSTNPFENLPNNQIHSEPSFKNVINPFDFIEKNSNSSSFDPFS